jgi:hypothetical protein
MNMGAHTQKNKCGKSEDLRIERRKKFLMKIVEAIEADYGQTNFLFYVLSSLPYSRSCCNEKTFAMKKYTSRYIFISLHTK